MATRISRHLSSSFTMYRYTFLYERQDADKENWLLYGKCEPVIILSAVGHPTNVSKF